MGHTFSPRERGGLRLLQAGFAPGCADLGQSKSCEGRGKSNEAKVTAQITELPSCLRSSGISLHEPQPITPRMGEANQPIRKQNYSLSASKFKPALREREVPS